MVIIDGTHRFLAFMIAKGITPEKYTTCASLLNLGDTNIFQIGYYPPIINKINVFKMATCSNFTNEAKKKDSLWTIVNFHPF